jgi:hypothetical protein
MPRGLIVVYSGPESPERDEEYNEWYDNVHIPEVCSVDGIISARRFRLSTVQRNPVDSTTPRYLAIYEIDTADLQTVADELGARLKNGTMHMTDAFVVSPGFPAMYFEEHEI